MAQNTLTSFTKNLINNRLIVGRHFVDHSSSRPENSRKPKVSFNPDVDHRGKVQPNSNLVDFSAAIKRSRVTVEVKLENLEQQQQNVLDKVDHQESCAVDHGDKNYSVDQNILSCSTFF